MRAWKKIAPATVVATGIAFAALPGFAQMRTPDKPIRLAVPFTAGGTPDTLARMIGPKMSENWRQPVVVENRPGAGGMMGPASLPGPRRTGTRCC